MTNLELVEHVPVKINDLFGKVMKRNVVAVSTSYSALVKHCKETYNEDVISVDESMDRKGSDGTYYTIHNSPIIIVQATQ